MKTTATLFAALTYTCHVLALSAPGSQQTAATSDLDIIILEIQLPSCNGASNGSISVEARGGKAPYTYNWNTFPAQSTPQAVNLSQGIYFIQVTDALGSVHFKSIEVQDPIQTRVNTTTMPAENQTVSIESNASMAYTCFLDGQKLTEPVINGLDIGIHKLVIESTTGCTVVQFIQVLEIEQTDSERSAVPATLTETTPLYSLETLEEANFTATLSMVDN